MKLEDRVANRFRLKEVIGRGSMGVVYRALDETSGDQVAIKHLRPFVSVESTHTLERFIREGEVLRRLDHPNIVVLLETIQEADDYFLVMEYVDGGSLSNLLKQTPQLPIRRILEIGLDVVDALIRAHRLDIIHRDVKPGNVLLTKSGVARLTDFGTAHIAQTSRLTETGMILGTYAYMSPEACRGEEVDGRTDIWSLGVMFFEMLTGRLPFNESNLMQLSLAIMTEPVPDLQALRPDAPVGLVDLIYRLLAKDRHQRIPTMRLVGAELELLLKGDKLDLPPSQEALRRFTDQMRLTQMRPFDSEATPTLQNLPTLPTPFIGREEEIAQARLLLTLSSTRLLTLHGPGGSGKTRLAIEVGRSLLEQFPHGVYFVDLATIETADELPQRIADAVRLRFFGEGTPWLQLLDYVQNKKLLLILDNFEPIASQASMLTPLISYAPGLHVLVTSRWRLQLQGESVLPVNGLPLPQQVEAMDWGKETAVDLFLSCARRIRADFAPTADDLTAIHAICQLVEGIPLEIELAASWISTLTPAEILAEIRANFGFLEAGVQDVPQRHRSVRSLMAYSWDLLNEEERQVLCSFSAFRGGFTREAAQTVTNASLRTLNALVNQSLLRREPASGRYEMQELLRQFTAERLTERPALKEDVHTRHITYYLLYFQEKGKALTGKDQLQALAAIEQELPNIRAAWRRAVQQENVFVIGATVDALYHFYQLCGRRQEGLEMLEQASQLLRSLPIRQHLAEAKVLARQGVFARFLGDREQAVSLLQESLDIARELGDKREIAFSLYQLGAADPSQPTAAAYWQESLHLAQELNDAELLAESLNWFAFVPYRQGQTAEAIQLLEASLNQRRNLGDRHGLAIALSNLGVIHVRRGENEQARRLLQESLRLYQPFHDLQGMAVTANNLSHAAINLRDYEAAYRWGRQAFNYAHEIGDQQTQAVTLTNLAEISLYRGKYDVAQKFCQEALNLRERPRPLPPEITSIIYNMLGRVALAQAAQKEARRYFQQALIEEAISEALTLEILAGLAEGLALAGEVAEAVALLTFVVSQAATEPAVKERLVGRLSEWTALLSVEQVTAAQARANQTNLTQWKALQIRNEK
jgi:serine/threonine protein kinase/predicted ATPase